MRLVTKQATKRLSRNWTRGSAGKWVVAPRARIRAAGKARDRGVAVATASGAERSQQPVGAAECRLTFRPGL